MYAVRPMPTTLSFHLSLKMHVFNVKSCTEYHEDKKGIKKEVTLVKRQFSEMAWG